MDCARAVSGFLRGQLLAFVFVAISVAFASPAHAQATLVLQQGLNGYTGAIDAKIAFDKPTTNIGGDPSNALIVDTSTALLMRYAIFQSEGGPLANNASIISATLSLYKDWGPDAVFKANRVLKNWTELGVTWTLTGTGASWSTAGVFSGDMLSTADGQGSVAAQPPVPNTQCNVDTPPFLDSCWLNIDVTSGVQAFQTGTANFGWKISFVSSTSDPSNPKEFLSKEASCCNREVRRPKLTIVYRAPPTASLSASPNPVAQNATITFDASGTTDGGSPITNLRLQFGDTTPDVNWTDKATPQPHVYTAAGTYTATLTATNAIGTSAPATLVVTVNPVGGSCTQVPTASFTASPSSGAAPLTVNFDTSTSSDTGGNCAITSLTLQYGDGQSFTWGNKNTPPPSHTYTSAQPSYTASLTATNAAGTSASFTRTITITTTNTSCTNPSTNPVATGYAVPTFHSMSIYVEPAGTVSGETIYLRYRKGSDTVWKQGHPVWYDGTHTPDSSRPYHGRGSVVHLDSGTAYVFEVSADNTNWQHVPGIDNGEPCPATWSETFATSPAAPGTVWSGTKTSLTSFFNATKGQSQFAVLLANQSGTPPNPQSGTPATYTLYDFSSTGGIAQAPTNPSDSETYAVIISGSYMILKGLKTLGGDSGIFIEPGSHDIIIDSVDISGYARDHGVALPAPLSGNGGANEDAGIKFPDSNYGPITATKRIVIQNSKIHNPAFGSTPWQNGSIHPYGPAGITMYPTGGQIVIRYNESYSTTNGTFGGPPDLNHYNQDGLVMGGCNDGCSINGMGPDIDIYKNRVMNYMDDGVEVDGNAINNRVWKNYFDYGGASAVSTAPTYIGPAYVWRNVYNRQRECMSDPWGNDSCNGGGRDPMIKDGGSSLPNNGKMYLYHNTSMQPPASSEPTATGPYPLGAGSGSGGGANIVSRNNVFETWKSNWPPFNTSGGDTDYDLTSASSWNGSEAHGYLSTTPQYQTGNGWQSYWNGKYRLAPGTSGYHDGTPIPNFNDMYASPDRGAHQDDPSVPDMDFGPGASGS